MPRDQPPSLPSPRRRVAAALAAALGAVPYAATPAAALGAVPCLATPAVALAATLAAAPATAAPPRLFAAPFAAVTADPGAGVIRRVRADLAAASTRWTREPGRGYDWVIAALTAETTGEVAGGLARGRYSRPDLVRAIVVQFYEIYAANAAAFARGAPVAPHWRRTLAWSRRMATGDRRPRPDAKAAAFAQVVTTLYAHMLTDLPVALLTLQARFRPAVSTADLRATFAECEDLFAPVLAREFSRARFTPAALGRAWPRLPGWLREVLGGDSHPLTLGALFLRLRRLAWLRFRAMSLRPSLRRAAAAAPAWRRLSPLPPPDPPPRQNPSRNPPPGAPPAAAPTRPGPRPAAPPTPTEGRPL